MGAPTKLTVSLLACGLGGMLVACASTPQPAIDPQADCIGPHAPQPRLGSCGWPRDVREFVARRDLCDHFRGEEAYNAQRGAFLVKRMGQTCTGSDAALARLKAKYRQNTALLPMLNTFEDSIE
ncbi:MAG: hypothetical protein Q4G62_03765 [Pseudomonadota bacterium]|nr:hypothetical protein [Pseudomonadota bacterium]